jgi:hypothetical protein
MKYILLAGAALMMAPLAQAADIKVAFSEDFSETLTDDYGTREGDYLTKRLTKDIEQAFGERLDQIGTISLIIDKAKPNRPTFKQMGDRPGLSMQSISIGGADVSGTVTDLSGNVIAELQYDDYETDIRQVVGSSTWSDANRTFDRFARKLSKASLSS